MKLSRRGFIGAGSITALTSFIGIGSREAEAASGSDEIVTARNSTTEMATFPVRP